MRSIATLFVCAPVLLAQATPVVQAVTNAGSNGPVSFNSLVSIWGQNLSAITVSAATFPWPTTLGNTQVFFCDASNGSTAFWLSKVSQCASAQLTYVSPKQINAVLPDSPGSYVQPFTATVKLVSEGLTDNGTLTNAPLKFTILPLAPGFFRMGYDCPYPANCSFSSTPSSTNSIARGSVIDQKGALITSQNPIRVGQVYSAYLTGVGLHITWGPSGPVHTGNLVDWPPFVSIGNPGTGNGDAKGVALWIGPSQSPGLYQINFSLPDDLRRIFTAAGTSLPSCQSVSSDISTELLFVASSNFASGFDQVSIPVFIGKSELACGK